MATNSKATRQAARDGQGYRTGIPKGEPRCDGCMHSTKPSQLVRQTSYDLLCVLHVCGCKTHGTCAKHVAKEAP